MSYKIELSIKTFNNDVNIQNDVENQIEEFARLKVIMDPSKNGINSKIENYGLKNDERANVLKIYKKLHFTNQLKVKWINETKSKKQILERRKTQ